MLIGFTLLGFAGILALLAGGKVPANFWASVWHGEGVLFLFVLAGIIIDATLFCLQLCIGFSQTTKRQAA